MRILTASTLALVAVLGLGCGDERDSADSPWSSRDDGGSNQDPTDPSDPTDPNDPSDPADPTDPDPTVAESVVGAWTGAARCTNSAGEQFQFETYWYLCPDGNMKGASVIVSGGTVFEMLDEGIYAVQESSALVTVSYWSTVVHPEIIRGDTDYIVDKLEYDFAGDSLTFTAGCPYPVFRIGTASNADCD